MRDERFDAWMAALESRHLSDLTFSELTRALRALSSAYVERRAGLRAGSAFDGAGKRAAFALFYGPLHYLLVREIVRAIPQASKPFRTLVDLGCGTGASGVAWAAACARPPRVLGVDRHPWALAEAAHTYRDFGVSGSTRQSNLSRFSWPKPPASIVAAFTVNELPDAERDVLLARLLDRARHGDQLLIVEPLARSVAPWWSSWRDAIVAVGGRADEWRFRTERPPIVAKLDRASSLDHRELTGRSIWIGQSAERQHPDRQDADRQD